MELYSRNLTDADKACGFELVRVRRPSSIMTTDTVDAVVYRIDSNNRIIKLNDPDGGERYKHQRFGRITTNDLEPPHWIPVGILNHATPEDAIRRTLSGFAERTEPNAPIEQPFFCKSLVGLIGVG